LHELNDLLGSNILNRLLPLYSDNSLRWIIILKSPVQEPGAAIPTANHDKSTFASLKVSDYRYLWIGMLGSAFAMNMQLVAQGWLVYEMTSSAMNLTYVTLAFMLPQIIFSPIGGVLADRINKKPIITWAPLANGIATLAMAYVVFNDHVTFEHFIVVGFLTAPPWQYQFLQEPHSSQKSSAKNSCLTPWLSIQHLGIYLEFLDPPSPAS